MKIAQFKCISGDFTCIREWYPWNENGELPVNDYVRLTEWVEVDLKPLPPEVTIPAQVAVLEKAADEVRAKAADAIRGIEQRKQELMALPAPVSA